MAKAKTKPRPPAKAKRSRAPTPPKEFARAGVKNEGENQQVVQSFIFNIKNKKGRFLAFRSRADKAKDKNADVKSADIGVTFPIDKRELDMIMPGSGVAMFSDFAYDENNRLFAGHLTMPIRSKRKPSEVICKIYDNPSDPLVFEECQLVQIKVALADHGVMTCTLTIILHDDPRRNTSRLRMLTGQDLMFDLRSQQETLPLTVSRKKDRKSKEQQKALPLTEEEDDDGEDQE